MKHRLIQAVSSVELAEVVGAQHVGSDTGVTAVAPASELGLGVLGFSVQPPQSQLSGSVLIATSGEHARGDVSVLVSDNPRLAFIQILHWLNERNLFSSKNEGAIDASAIVHPTAIVEAGATIGAGCEIGPYAHIHSSVTLSRNVKVGAGSVLGHDGFGFERDNAGQPLHFPHLAGLDIADNVTIGNHCCIARGTLDSTCIGSGVAMDDQVYIAHNVTVAENVLIMSGVRLNGRVHVAKDVWLGTGSMIREGVSVGSQAVVGMGSVVVKDVDAGQTIVGNPGRKLEPESV